MTKMTDRDARLESLIANEYPKLARYLRTKVPCADVLDLAQAILLAIVDAPVVEIEDDRVLMWRITRRQVIAFYDEHGGLGVPFDGEAHRVADMPRMMAAARRRG